MTGTPSNGSPDNFKATIDELLKQNEEPRARVDNIEQTNEGYEEEREEYDGIGEPQPLAQELWEDTVPKPAVI
ncbi:hypothetical protein A2U01_0083702 [Trifolium medium]|uniref:Uncharacterized protein n=1 Tax=Trifolium medium TaxID=97028 RepID=A0A392TRG0_9FABA|nr:hypothetical protein [Trifolium medium]